MSRQSRAVSERIFRVGLGEQDVLSRAAYHARVPICDAVNPWDTAYRCTRAHGHDESAPGHPSSDHVSTGFGFATRAVWR